MNVLHRCANIESVSPMKQSPVKDLQENSKDKSVNVTDVVNNMENSKGKSGNHCENKQFSSVSSIFPGALSNAELMDMVVASLTCHGYDTATTLVATSLCCDEVNRPLEKEFGKVFDTTFNMGGLAGFPFGGITSFGAMAAHIPDGGSCLVVYGPHVGIDSSGVVGTVERRGRSKGGACCGSAVAASVAVGDAYAKKVSLASNFDALDAQQHFVASMLMPHAERLEEAADKMVELPYALFDSQTKMIKQILEKGAGSVANESKIAVLGGIQINTPTGFTDYFLPLRFDIYSDKGTLTQSIMPRSTSRHFPQVRATFPEALSNTDLLDMVKGTLDTHGYAKSKTLVATSLCCDEVNRPLERNFAETYNQTFNIGGLAGFPFGGVTGFGAMAAHIPDGGSCLVVYGPHVGIDSNGVVGTVERRGRANGGACCGSAVAAAGYVRSVYKDGAEEVTKPTDAIDAQQYYVGSMLMPYAEQLEDAENKMVELPHALFHAQTKVMKDIIRQTGGAVAGDGKIALLGGIQINTPAGFTDYFLPLSFDLFSSAGVHMKDLMPRNENKPFAKVKSSFLGSFTNSDLLHAVTSTLEDVGYDTKSTLVATSLCCDEVNRPLEKVFQSVFDTTFNMGGLAGFPFGGTTGFGAMAAHVPDDGSCLVVYGPHVGMDLSGAVGTVNRRGRQNGGACCGSAVAAMGHVEKTIKEGGADGDEHFDTLDAQQFYVGSMLMPYAKQLENADNKMIELPHALFDAQTKMMEDIVGKCCGSVSGNGTIAVLGGIQINTPECYSDYFLPLKFDLYNNKGAVINDLLQKMISTPVRRASPVARYVSNELSELVHPDRITGVTGDTNEDEDSTIHVNRSGQQVVNEVEKSKAAERCIFTWRVLFLIVLFILWIGTVITWEVTRRGQLDEICFVPNSLIGKLLMGYADFLDGTADKMLEYFYELYDVLSFVVKGILSHFGDETALDVQKISVKTDFFDKMDFYK